MIIYLDADFNPVDKDKAVMAKVIPDNNDPPYFVTITPPAPTANSGQGLRVTR